jgi:hypothetical protein
LARLERVAFAAPEKSTLRSVVVIPAPAQDTAIR